MRRNEPFTSTRGEDWLMRSAANGFIVHYRGERVVIPWPTIRKALAYFDRTYNSDEDDFG